MATACLGIFANLFPNRASSSPHQATLPLLREEMGVGNELDNKAGCIFCDVSIEKGFRVVGTTPTLIAFHDRSPGAKTHILVIPRTHISTVKDLRERHIPLLTEMEIFGHKLLDEIGVKEADRRLGFHIPPFSSVHHIHLHVLSLPLSHGWAKVKYRSTTFRKPPSPTSKLAEEGLALRHGKKWGWFVEVRDAKDILSAGKTIKVARVHT